MFDAPEKVVLLQISDRLEQTSAATFANDDLLILR